jgi:autotransporter-associated beta strand protein
VAASGTLTIENAAALGSGSLTISNGAAIGCGGRWTGVLSDNPQNWSGNFTFVGTQSLNLGNGAVTLGGNSTANVSASVLTVGGAVVGPYSLTKSGAGTLTLSGASSFSGGMVLNAGQLNINNPQALGAGPFTIAGTSTINNSSAGSITLSTDNPQTWNADFTFIGTKALSLGNGPVTLGGNRTLTVAASMLTVGGAIGGTNSLTKAGAGTLSLGGANTYSGTTTVAAGTLLLQNQYALQNSIFVGGSGTLTFDSGVSGHAFTIGGLFGSSGLDLRDTAANPISLSVGNNNTGTIYTGVLSGSGSLTKIGTGLLELLSANTFTGGFTLAGGQVDVINASSLGSGIFTVAGNGAIDCATYMSSTTSPQGEAWNSSFTFVGSTNLNLGTGAVTLGTNVTLTVGTNTLTVGGAVGGQYGLTKDGAGTLVLNGANTYSGATTILAGALQVAASDSLPSYDANGSVSVASGATLIANYGGPKDWNSSEIDLLRNTASFASGSFLGFDTTNASNGAAYASNIDGNIGVSKYGTNALTLSGNNTFTGGTVLNAGQLNINNPQALGTGPFTIAGTSTIDNTTTGPITLANNNTEAWNASFTFAGTQPLNLGTGDIALRGNCTVTVAASMLTVGGAIGGGYSLTKAGAGVMVLSGENSYSGTTTISAGTLVLQNQYALLNSTFAGGSGTLVFDSSVSGHAFTFGGICGSSSLVLQDNAGNPVALSVGNNNLDFTYTGVLSGSGSLAKIGTGMLALSGANTYTGKTTVIGGNLLINSDAALGSSPSSFTPDQLTLNGGTLETTASFTLASNRGITVGPLGGSLSQDSGTGLVIANPITATGNLTMAGYGTLTLAAANTLSGGLTLCAGQLNIGDPQAIGTGMLTLAASGSVTIDNTSTGPIVLPNNPQQWNSLGYATLIFGGTQDLDLGTGPIALPGSFVINVASKTLTIGGVIGPGGITKTGSGALVLKGANTITSMALLAGTLVLQNQNALQDSVLDLDGGTLVLDSAVASHAFTFGGLDGTGNLALQDTAMNTVALTVGNYNQTSTYYGVLSGSGSLTKIGSGVLTLSGTNTYTGKTTVTGGTLSIAADSGLGTSPGSFVADQLTLDGSTLQTTATLTLASSRGITLGAGGGTLSSTSGLVTVAGVIAGSGSLSTTGYGAAIFAAANTYTGKTIIAQNGTLAIGSDANLGTSPQGFVADQLLLDSGTLQATASFTINNNRGITLGAGGGTFSPNAGVDLTVTNPISGTGKLTEYGSGTLTLSAANSFSGGMSLNSGQLNLNNAQALGSGTFTIGGGSIDNTSAGPITLSASNPMIWYTDFTFAGTQDLNLGTGVVTLTGSRTVTVTAKTLTVGGPISGGNNMLVKNGPGTLVLANANTYSGWTNVNGGTLTLQNQNALQNSPLAVGFGTLVFDSQVAGHAFTFGGLSGSGSLTLQDNAANPVALSVGNSGASTSFAGVLSGSGSLTKIGTGKLTLSGTNSYLGNTTINAGTLTLGTSGSIGSSPLIDVNSGATFDVSALTSGVGLGNAQTLQGAGTVVGSVTAAIGSHISPGDGVGTLTIGGNLTLSNGALLDYELGTISNSDMISMTGSTLYLNSQDFSDFNFIALSGFGAGTYTLIDAKAISGSLSTSNLSGPIGSGYNGTLAIVGNDLVLTTTAVPEPGTLSLLAAGLMSLLAYAWRKHGT